MNMTTTTDIITEARKYLGVRWQHQGRNMAGIDCIGLVFAVAHALKLTTFHTANYGRIPDGTLLRQGLEQHLVQVDQPVPGCVLLMCFDNFPQHLAIQSDIGIIHAYAQARKVVEHRLDAVWSSRVVSAYAFPGVQP